VSQVNEFLKQMEQHSGILVCCTNLLDRLDSASMRRFTFKVTYRSPDAAAREELFSRYFPAIEPEPKDLDRLKNLAGLTPGDFAAVARRWRYAAAPPTASQLMGGLEAELGYREPDRRVVGFGI
jgi:SpoVK/Ycf46/Vps4 family AAA+-type ATPase